MNRPLQQARRAVALRLLAITALWVLPLLAAVLAWGLRLQAPLAAGLVAAVLALLAFASWHRQRVRHDDRWLTRRLNDDPAMQDSADLLFSAPEALGPLQRLQRDRVAQQLSSSQVERKPAWPRRALLASLLAGTIAVLAAILLPMRDAPPAPGTAAPTVSVESDATELALLDTRVLVRPPGYTGLPERSETDLSLQAPAGSMLRWRLKFSSQPEAVLLRWHDGGELALEREGEDWVGEHTLTRSLLYRIVTSSPLPLVRDDLHRLDAIEDQAPAIRVISPVRPLTLRSDGQRQWSLDFEASDDHGLGQARLFITLAQGSGEQVEVSERSLMLRGEGGPTLRRYRHTLDLAALGLAEGDDLIVRLEVSDQREPEPRTSRSSSLILRWPMPPATEATGMEGLVQKALPAYFRSQRQIILDIEALVPQRPALSDEEFIDRSDTIGVDQRILRMRYGQFLGEENDGGAEPPPGLDEGDDEAHGDEEPAQPAGDGHDHADEPGGALGGSVNVLEQYGHTHDDAEAATLLDPQTRALLRQALDAMWSSEGELRRGQPERALPHAYRALQFIKQVQQASRIYLARVGLELPPIDESRRMGGDREGIADRRDGLAPAELPETPVPALWRALADTDGRPDLAPMTAWLETNADQVDDPLSLLAALETLRTRPGCTDCRQRLRDLLWPLLPRPVVGVDGRPAPDAAGQAYLDALSEETSP